MIYNIAKVLLISTLLAVPAYSDVVNPSAENEKLLVEKKSCKCKENCECKKKSHEGTPCCKGETTQMPPKLENEKLPAGKKSCKCKESCGCNKKTQEVTPYCKGAANQLYLKVGAKSLFSFHYGQNQEYFKLSKHLFKINNLPKGKGPSSASDVKPMRNVGISGEYDHPSKVLSRSSVSIETKYKMADLAYGILLEPEFNIHGGISTKNAYIFVDAPYGRFNLGSIDDSATGALKVDASSVAALGSAIEDLDWTKVANLEGRPEHAVYNGNGGGGGQNGHTRHKNASHPFLIHPDYYVDYDSPVRANFTTTIGKLVVAAGYTNRADGGTYRDILDFGFGYTGNKKNLNYSFSVTAQTSPTEPRGNLHHPLQRLEVGAMAGLYGVKVAGSFGNSFLSGIEIRKNMQLERTKGVDDDAQYVTTDGQITYMTLGTAFETDRALFSVNYMRSDNVFKKPDKNTLQVISVGEHYRFRKGAYELTPYVNCRYFTTSEAGVPKENNNEGYVISSGLRVSY